jgi:transketolase
LTFKFFTFNFYMKSISDLQSIASQVRRDILRQVHSCSSGHPGGSLGCADLLTALYFRVMNHHTSFNMEAKGEDVFYLSNGHISPVFYSVLARSGYFDVAELATFRKLNSRLQGHPTTHEHLPGVRTASGSLGQGMSVAIGHALAKKMDGDNSTIFCLTGDGELQEGQVWEAAMFAPHNKVDNLVVIVDVNGRQIDGDTKDVLSLGDLRAKWESFGWNVLDMKGNDMADVVSVLENAKAGAGSGLPTAILMETEMGWPIDFMVGSHKWHGVAPNDEQLAAALSQVPETLGDY